MGSVKILVERILKRCVINQSKLLDDQIMDCQEHPRSNSSVFNGAGVILPTRSKYSLILVSVFLITFILTCEEQVYDNPYDPAYVIAPPSNLRAVPISKSSIMLSWENSDSSNMAFRIVRKTTKEFELVGESKIGDSTFIDTGLTYGTNYVYRVVAFAGENQSEFSIDLSITLVIPIPTNVIATWLSDQVIKVEWDDNSLFETSFKIERAINDTNFDQLLQLPSNTTSLIDTVTLLGWHRYRVKAITDSHESDYSNIASGWSGITFNKTFNYGPKGKSVSQTTDGGYIIAGGYNGLFKTDSFGNDEWYMPFSSVEGGISGYSVIETKDWGYVVTGINNSKTILIKTDINGNVLWYKTLSGDVGFSVKQTIDNGYIVCGKIYKDATWWTDMILIKTDSDGNELWSNTFGGGLIDEAYSVQQTLDGGYIITGEKDAGGGLETKTKMWLVKTDANGNEEWNYVFSSGSSCRGESVQQTKDKGYIIAGSRASNLWLIKISSIGVEEWNYSYSGVYSSLGYSVCQTNDEGYVVVGRINSAEVGSSNVDVYLIKTDQDGTIQWEKVLGSGYYDAGYSVLETNDHGYIITGETDGHVWLIKTDPVGNVY